MTLKEKVRLTRYSMKLIIHRGTKEIGGSCVELQTGKSRILIDFGIPLITNTGERFDIKDIATKTTEDLIRLNILPDIKGLYKGQERAIDAILVSHAHLDHYGFLEHVNQDIPVYMSRGAKELIDITNIFVTKNPAKIEASLIKHMRPFQVGDFKITPYLVDHSAFDALAFMVEAEGKKVFYSGDFRGHGTKSLLFDMMLKDPPKDIDCLVMEGSMIGRKDWIYKDEQSVQARIEKILRENNNITFLFTSSQNIDRLVSAYKACLSTGSIFVIDIYTAFVLDKLRKVSKNIPQFNWRNIKIAFIKYHADVLASAGYRSLLYAYNKQKIDMFDINRQKNNILLMAKDNSVFPSIVKNIDNVSGAKLIYSMWEGYLTDKFKEYCKEKKIDIESVHTSGHATIEDLKAFAKALNPKTLVPIHTFASEKYPELFENVKILDDKEAMEIN
jgi:ribonuclease J